MKRVRRNLPLIVAQGLSLFIKNHGQLYFRSKIQFEIKNNYEI